ncbi:MAG: Flp family type IVb pilin [Phycisphaerae bacterium]
MIRLMRAMQAFLRSEEGATATEYAVMIALVLLVCIGAVAALGDKVSGGFVTAEQEWSTYYP